MQQIYRIIRIALVLLLAYHVPLKAQDQRNKGFIGVGIGPSFLAGNNSIKAGAGLNLSLLHAGYTIGKGFGVTGIWAGGAHLFDAETIAYDQGTPYTLPASVEMSYGMLMIGPMYTWNMTDNASLDFKARMGSLYTSEKSTSETHAFTSDKMTLSASLGVGYRKKFANRWCMMLSSDYYAGRKQFTSTSNQNTHIISLTTGVGFVF